MTVRVGPYLLRRRLGSGGMGEVWWALHEPSALPVAIKLITRIESADEHTYQAFRNEVLAHASLHHPYIAMVYDYGRVPSDVDPGGTVVPSAPYIAMELADRGSLHAYRGKLPWDQLKGVLVCLLDALGHAHARGVIHRDLKPGNVLLAREAIRLTDFGLATAFGEGTRLDRVAGTPAYMAPEQFETDARAYGPWTDLYALGCLAFALATGRPPFGSATAVTTMHAHRDQPVPRLEAKLPVPDGFEDWVGTLLRKDPGSRYQCAMDAAWALSQLAAAGAPSRSGGGTLGVQSQLGDLPADLRAPQARGSETDDPSSAIVPQSILPTLVFDGMTPRASSRPSEGLAPPGPPLVLPWRPPEVVIGRESDGIRGVGLGLFGIRPIPLVGREPERDRLWSLLVDVQREGRPKVALVRGGVGTGKSRLCAWLTERATELGAAWPVVARFDRERTSGTGIVEMIERTLRTSGLARGATRERIRRWGAGRGLSGVDLDGLLALLRPDRGAGGIRFSDPAERDAEVIRFLRACAHDRPVVLWIDDVQWGADGVRLLHAIAHGPGFPILAVATVQDDALEETAVEKDRVGSLARDAIELRVGPLDPALHRVLVEQHLGLKGDLAVEVGERTGGNPLFAVQLVGGWIEQGVLLPSARGFELGAGRKVDWPGSLQDVWRGQIDAVTRTEEERLALEIAALLGQEVDAEAWEKVSVALGAKGGWALVDRLVGARLAVVHADTGRWSFVHAAMRGVLVERSQALKRATVIHQAAARELEQLGSEDAERLARHHFHAGAWAQARPYLWRAIERRMEWGDFGHAELLLGWWETAAQESGMEPETPERAGPAILRIRMAVTRGELGEAERLASSLLGRARDHRWLVVEARALREKGWIARNQGRRDEAEADLTSALALGRERGVPDVVTYAERDLGYLWNDAGRFVEAGASFERALEAARVEDDRTAEASIVLGQGITALQQGRLARAREHFVDARTRFELLGTRLWIATTDMVLADVDRLEGRLADAEQGYRAATALYDRIGRSEAGDALFGRVNLAITLIERKRPQEARSLLEDALRQTVAQGRTGQVGALHVCLLPCVASSAEWQAWDDHLVAARTLLGQTGLVETDVARMAEVASEIAERFGQRTRAQDALTLAIEQWRALGRSENVERLEKVRG